MSSSRRPWYPWYPSDFNQDEKVRMLSDDAELLYRRALDVLWQANDLQMPSNWLKLGKALARGWSEERFKNAWEEIQTPGFELLKTTDDGLWVYSKRLKVEAERFLSISQTRKIASKKAVEAKANQMVAKSQPNGNHVITQPQPHIKKKIIKEKSQIPSDFTLTEKMIEFAVSKNISPQNVESVFEHFKDHHMAKGSVFKDWTAAWRTWCQQSLRFGDRQIHSQPKDELKNIIGKRLA